MTASTSTAAARTRRETRAGIRLTPRATILALVLIAVLAYSVGPLQTFLGQRERLDRLEHQANLLERENAELRDQIARLNDPEYLERVARERLGMVRPGEIGFVVVPEDEAAAGG